MFNITQFYSMSLEGLLYYVLIHHFFLFAFPLPLHKHTIKLGYKVNYDKISYFKSWDWTQVKICILWIEGGKKTAHFYEYEM